MRQTLRCPPLSTARPALNPLTTPCCCPGPGICSRPMGGLSFLIWGMGQFPSPLPPHQGLGGLNEMTRKGLGDTLPLCGQDHEWHSLFHRWPSTSCPEGGVGVTPASSRCWQSQGPAQAGAEWEGPGRLRGTVHECGGLCHQDRGQDCLGVDRTLCLLHTLHHGLTKAPRKPPLPALTSHTVGGGFAPAP